MDGEEDEIDWVGIAQQLDEESEAEKDEEEESEEEEATARVTATQQVISPLSLLVVAIEFFVVAANTFPAAGDQSYMIHHTITYFGFWL